MNLHLRFIECNGTSTSVRLIACLILVTVIFISLMEVGTWPVPNANVLGTGHAHASVVFKVR